MAPGEPKIENRRLLVNQLYSPRKEWPETAAESIEAETGVDLTALTNRRESVGSRLPAGVAMLTVGVDVQANRCEVELVGWECGEERWSCGYHLIPGDPSAPALWEQLDEFLHRQWLHECGPPLRAAAAAIDSGFHTEAVYRFCRERYHRRIFAVKGKARPIPVWPKRPTRSTLG